jgi:phage baseplate assembly protein V
MASEQPSAGRFGYVSAYDPARNMARVRFPDKDNLVSAWLPVSAQNSKKNKAERHLDIDEHVYCDMLGNGLEAGVVLCAVFDDKNKPPLGNQDIQRTTFEDGTVVQYDRAARALTVDCSGSGGTVAVIAPGGVSIQGDVSVTGNLSVSGDVSASGSVADAAGNTNHHSH